jgi:hypothetical protein
MLFYNKLQYVVCIFTKWLFECWIYTGVWEFFAQVKFVDTNIWCAYISANQMCGSSFQGKDAWRIICDFYVTVLNEWNYILGSRNLWLLNLLCVFVHEQPTSGRIACFGYGTRKEPSTSFWKVIVWTHWMVFYVKILLIRLFRSPTLILECSDAVNSGCYYEK